MTDANRPTNRNAKEIEPSPPVTRQPVPGHQEFIPSRPQDLRGNDPLPTDPDTHQDADRLPATGSGRSDPPPSGE